MITLTAPAVDKVRELVAAEEGDAALRVGVKPGGCSGYKYEMFFDTNVDELEDFVKDYDGVKVVIDRASGQLIQGAEIDFVEGLQGTGFKVNNPNVTKACGCGQSFN
ncbi:MAG: iron-sulfur cluster assembly accessory protein [Acidimicrobiia bacterium]|nr:iron-sulfur cluster assembly accessory protein [Acidimicrobiia bacterium]